MGVLNSVMGWFGYSPTAPAQPAESSPYPLAPKVTRERILTVARDVLGEPRRVDLAHDQIVSDIVMLPYRSRFDSGLGNYARETPNDYAHYRYQYRRDPVVRDAILSKTTEASCLDVTVLPGRVDDPRQIPLACEIADFVEHTVARADGGWVDVIDKIYGPAPVDGFTLCPKKLDVCRWRGRNLWGFGHLRSMDVRYIRLQTDVYRNVVAIVNTVRGLEYYNPEQAVLFNLNPQYGDPFGQSDMTCVSRASDVIQQAYEAWIIAVEVYGLPYMVAVAGKPTQKQALAEVLGSLREGGYAVIEKDDDVKAINLAAASGMNGFESLIHTRREDIFFGVNGSPQPFMEGDGGSNAHTDTEVQAETKNTRVRHDTKRIANCIQHQIVPWLVIPNWGPDAPMPTIHLGGLDVKKIKEWTEVLAKMRKELGIEPSKQTVQKLLNVPEARDKTDRLGPDQDAGGLIGTTQGLTALSQLQAQFTSGQLSQAACVATMGLVFKLPAEEALKLFPTVQPVDRTQQPQPGQPQTQPPPTDGGQDPLSALDQPEPSTFSDAHDSSRWSTSDLSQVAHDLVAEWSR